MPESHTKRYKYSIDEWVTYRPHPDIQTLKHIKHKALVLDVLHDDFIYDYYIFVDVVGDYKKVKQAKLSHYDEKEW